MKQYASSSALGPTPLAGARTTSPSRVASGSSDVMNGHLSTGGQQQQHQHHHAKDASDASAAAAFAVPYAKDGSEAFSYSTSLRRHEPDHHHDLFGGGGGGSNPYAHDDASQQAQQQQQRRYSGAQAQTTAAAPTAAAAEKRRSSLPTHHPFAHTASPLTPSQHFASLSVAESLSQLGTASVTHGLDSGKVAAVRELAGANEFEVGAKEPAWRKFVDQFKESPLILLLIASAGVSALVGNFDDAASILAAIIIVVTVGFVQEQRSEKSLEALNKLVPHFCHLIRDGHKSTQLANVLVPGDLVTFRTGDRVPADVRLVSCAQLEIDESSLTGETKPAVKQTEPIARDFHHGGLSISERSNIAFMGTLVKNGHGTGVVVGTGMQSEFGVVFSMMQEVDDRKTPLQLSMDELAKKLSAISFAVIAVICLIGVWQQRSWLEMFTIGVSLAVAAIPEGLPIVVTVTLALGVLRMSKRNAIVKKLPSVETLGSVSVICSDKTGTLTTNVMTVLKAYTVEHGIFDIADAREDAQRFLFLVGNMCNHSHRDRKGLYVGQATEVALMNALAAVGLDDQRATLQSPTHEPFNSERKTQSVSGVFASISPDRQTVFLSGALEAVLRQCRFYLRANNSTAALEPGMQKVIAGKAADLAASGLRVVAMAYGLDADAMVFVGFQAMMDPPRPGVDEAISLLNTGGVQVVMITGDAEETALAIARQLGIKVSAGSKGCLTGREIDLLSQRQLTDRVANVSVFARTTPRHKMAIIEAFQTRGAVVAMTGDGVNDAPALKMADIGVAMGKGGTDVAKEAADVILVDDNFTTLLPAVEEGKGIFTNIQNFLTFQLSTAVSALSLITLSTALRLPNPLNPMQILFINILMDGPPSQSLGVDPVNREVMQRPPRAKDAPILHRRLLLRIVFSASMIIFGVLFIYMRELGDGSTGDRDQTMTFTSFVFLDLVSAIQNRGLSVPLTGTSANRMLLTTVSISFLVQLSLVYVPFLQAVFQTEALSFRDLTVLLLLGGCSMSLHEVRRRWERREAVDEVWTEQQSV